MRTWKSLVAIAACCAAAAGAWAQSYPTRPIRLVVPFAAGGSTDLIARITAEQLRKELGQAVVVENVGGAAGALGTMQVKNAAPDGYTLLVATVSTMIVYPAAHPKPQYSLEDFAPITNIASMPNVISVNPKFPANNLTEFVAALKANPDKYSFATSGVGSINHMLGESFQAEVQPMVVDVEGKTLQLKGTAEEQFTEWRRLLKELYENETGLPVQVPAAIPDKPAAATAGGSAH